MRRSPWQDPVVLSNYDRSIDYIGDSSDHQCKDGLLVVRMYRWFALAGKAYWYPMTLDQLHAKKTYPLNLKLLSQENMILSLNLFTSHLTKTFTNLATSYKRTFQWTINYCLISLIVRIRFFWSSPFSSCRCFFRSNLFQDLFFFRILS
jgi:hypothetical protein